MLFYLKNLLILREKILAQSRTPGEIEKVSDFMCEAFFLMTSRTSHTRKNESHKVSIFFSTRPTLLTFLVRRNTRWKHKKRKSEGEKKFLFVLVAEKEKKTETRKGVVAFISSKKVFKDRSVSKSWASIRIISSFLFVHASSRLESPHVKFYFIIL